MTRKVRTKRPAAQATTPANPQIKLSSLTAADILPAGEKFSGVILRFAEPLLHKVAAADYEIFFENVSLAIVAWNLASIPQPERDIALVEMLKTVPLMQRWMVKQELKIMIKRKNSLFADHIWLVHDYKITDTEAGYRVSVEAGLPEQALEKLKEGK